MANFITRFVHMSVAKGFYTWYENLKEHKNRQRFLRMTLLYWVKNAEANAFRRWSEYALRSKEAELQQELENKEKERKELTETKEKEEKEQNAHIDQLTQDVTDANQLKDQLKANYEKALETHVGRIKKNYYVDKKRNILLVWAEFIKREKNAINVIGAITRKYLKQEVFSRIRLTARENYLEDNAERIVSNYGRLFKQAMLRGAFSRWRLNNYTCLVGQMESKIQELNDTQAAQSAEMSHMTLHKQRKAERILRQKRQREISQAWIAMTKTVK